MSEPTFDLSLPALPLGESSFSALRSTGEIYVDKTDMVFELARTRSKIFLARPRRFGKSLLVSTFYSLFKHGLKDFSGLAIEKLWRDEGRYTVVELDFSLVKNFHGSQDFREQLNDYLLERMQMDCLVDHDFPAFANGIREFNKWLARQPDNSVVLLIDEYDGPLTSSLTDSNTFEEVRTILATFYSCLKNYSGSFRFLFLTGITKFGNAGIFSELNALRDITLSPRFGTIAGYTFGELVHYFGAYIQQASEVLKVSESELTNKLVESYNGFCFEETAIRKVFSPWSILNFFTEPERGFRNYWFESGGQPSVLLSYIKEHSLTQPAEFLQRKSISLSTLSSSSSSYEVKEEVLLFQTGYLTIKDRKENTLYLGYPNQEVADSMAELYLERLLRGKDLNSVNAGGILQALSKGEIEGFVKRVNNAFLALDFERYFIRDEMSCQGAFLLILLGSGVNASIETHNAFGRSDIEFTVGGSRWVIELKFAKGNKETSRKLHEGLQQLKKRHYGEQSFEGKLIRLVMVFSEKDRRFVRFGLEDPSQGPNACKSLQK